MIIQITMIKNELHLLKEMFPQWQKYADGFIFMDDNSDDGSYEYLMENKEKFNILKILKSGNTEDKLTVESNIRQRLFDEAFEHSGHIICLDADEYLDGTISKENLENILKNNKNVIFYLRWIQYTSKNQVRVDGPWKVNYKDRVASYDTHHIYGDRQMHSEHLPTPQRKAVIELPNLFIAHLQWLDKETVGIKQYFWKITDYVNKQKFNADIISPIEYDNSVNNFNWTCEDFLFELKVSENVYKNQDLKNNYKYRFIQDNIKKYNIPNLNDWGMDIHDESKYG